MRRRFFLPTLLLLAFFSSTGTGPAHAQNAVSFPSSDLSVVTADGKSHHFTIELATTPEQHSRGLMFRHNLAADAGMLFDFGHKRMIAMWMKNTFIPLDMVFIDDNGRILRIAERTVPQSLETISSGEEARAVLEVNGGTAARLGIHPGDRVVHPIFATAQ